MCMGVDSRWGHNRAMQTQEQEALAQEAARWVVEEGMDYGSAKRRALQSLGSPARTPLPSNRQVEEAVREHLSIFHADTQPRELQALRELALQWMRRLAAFRPHIAGAVWRGTATRLNDVHLHLFCDDPKSAELHLIDQNVRYDVSTLEGFHGEPVDALSVAVPCPALAQTVWVHLVVYDHDDVRGALKPDESGLSWRGSLSALERKMEEDQAT